MNKRIKKLWTDALKSGKYLQGHNRLKTDLGFLPNYEEKFCCLGVLCDLYINSPTGKKNRARWENGCFYSDVQIDSDGTPLSQGTYLPSEVTKWAKIKKWVGQSNYCGWMEVKDNDFDVCSCKEEKTTTLSYVNDSKNCDFNQIATLIEKYL